MCGIVAVFETKGHSEELRPEILKMSKKIRHRGPDWSGIYCGENAILAHERLSIVDPESGGQPLKSRDGRIVLTVNGEIYNHRELRKEFEGKYDFMTGSDCEVIIPLYLEYGTEFLEKLNGIFAFALYDTATGFYMVARDHIGIIPLYMGFDKQNRKYFASELKALEGKCDVIEPFLPGNIYDNRRGELRQWYARDWTPMYLLARVIKSMGIKMVLSGEGADEIFGGYLYFHKAPDAKAFHEETVRKLSKLHLYDCLRTNKSLSAWGVEGRVPFLDKEFLDVAMSINPADKMACDGKIEKWVLRKAFEHLLPQEIAWRQKEQFSDGVGYSWIDSLKEITASQVTDEMMKNAARRFPVNTPMNKEEYFYRSIFEEHFPSATAAACVPSVPSVACSTAEALTWDESFRNCNDPSGRAVSGIHEKAYADIQEEVTA